MISYKFIIALRTHDERKQYYFALNDSIKCPWFIKRKLVLTSPTSHTVLNGNWVGSFADDLDTGYVRYDYGVASEKFLH